MTAPVLDGVSAPAPTTCAYQAGWRSRATGPRLVGSRIGPLVVRP
ncbi:hypothetical protein KPATCC21470_8034 [Kitasatospora purpeofusca]